MSSAWASLPSSRVAVEKTMSLYARIKVVNSAKRAGSVEGFCTEGCPFSPRTPRNRKSCDRTQASPLGDVARPRHIDHPGKCAYTWIHWSLPSGGARKLHHIGRVIH